MIIAIDEVGAFEPYSKRYNYMVAALISQRGDSLQIKKGQFVAWKNTINTNKFNWCGEVKGTELDEAELYRFATNVIIVEPVVRSVQIRIIPAENPQYVVEIYKMVEADLIMKLQQHFTEIGDEVGALFFKRFLNWFNHRNFQHYFKLLLIQYCISRSLQQAFGASIVDWALGNDTNLMNMEIKIDGDFIKKSGEKKYFNELLRQSFKQITEIHPIPMARELVESNHQFAQEYLLGRDQVNLGKLFVDKCTFLNSHENFELQIADILGTIFHRAENTGTCHNSLAAINATLGNRAQIKQHLVLNKDPNLDTKIIFQSAELG